jgi:hypothetical protein
MRRFTLIISVALVAAAVLSGCKSDPQVAQGGTNGTTLNRVAGTNLPAGTSIDITLATALTSETARVGSAWTGSVSNPIVLEGRNVVPAGSSVTGTVTAVKAAQKGDRAMLDLGLSSITVGSHTYRVQGSTEAIIAGSTRARNLGAIGAATVAGAIVGHQVNHSDKGTIIGGLIGGAAATGVVSQTDGYQVELKPGTGITFTTSQTIAVRL